LRQRKRRIALLLLLSLLLLLLLLHTLASSSSFSAHVFCGEPFSRGNSLTAGRQIWQNRLRQHNSSALTMTFHYSKGVHREKLLKRVGLDDAETNEHPV